MLADKQRAAKVEKNRKLLKHVIRAVLLCAKQYIALRGDSENLATPGNHGNFLALLQLLLVNDEALRDHLESPAMKNCYVHVSSHTK